MALCSPRSIAQLVRLAVFSLLGCARPAATPSAPSPAPLALAPCKLPGGARELRCGRFEVWEDRSARTGRKIALRVVVVPATGPERAPDPIFIFAGGPGDSAVGDITGGVGELAELNRTRDIVAVDVRGTGDSNGLFCRAMQDRTGVLGVLNSFLPIDGVKACRKDLESRANLALYTTAASVDDVDDVRAALGYDRINLDGASYGTRAALEYMRRHPAHVRTAMLLGLVPPDTRAPLYFASDAQRALDQVFAACAADAGCHAAFPDLAGEFSRLLSAVERHPVAAEAIDPKTGERLSLELTRAAVAQTVRYMLYTPATAARVPLEIHLASGGNWRPLAASALRFGGLVSALADGYFLSTTCAEDVPMFSAEDAARETAGTFLGEIRTRAQKAACAEWPRGTPPPDDAEPVHSDAPVLLLSGERDPVTPARWAEVAARTLPHSVQIVVPGGGHGFAGEKGAECIDHLVTAFIERGSERDLDTRCAAQVVPAPFALRDETAPEVAIAPAELDRFVGSYASDDGTALVVSRSGAALRATFGGEGPLALTPIGPTRFRIEGAPPGAAIEFERGSDAVTGAVLVFGDERRPLHRTRAP